MVYVGSSKDFGEGIGLTIRKKGILIVVVIVVIAALLVVAKLFFFKSNPSAGYEFDTAQKATVTQLVNVNGNVITPRDSDVFSPTTGVITDIYVKNGDSVKKGDKLFAVQSAASAAEQSAAFAAYRAAQAGLTAAQNNQVALEATESTKQDAYNNAINTQNYKNTHTINPATSAPYTDLEKQTIDSAVTPAQKELTAALKAFQTAGVAIKSAQSQVEAALLAYKATQDATVTAQADGIVSNVGLPGTRVTASAASTSNTSGSGATTPNSTASSPASPPVLIIGIPNDYAVRAAINEIDINKLVLGQEATIRVSGVSNKTYAGTITQIDSRGATNQGIVTYGILLAIVSPDNDMKSNMTANLSIRTAEHKDVLTVANTAIVPYQNEKAVQILNDKGQVEFKKIQVGLRGFTRTEIMSGIGAGTKVILGNTALTNNSGGASGVLGY